ncbi:MAG: (deoxy)nucleoside triphosphate pyrophosphohydrolase [Myxococcales bacterium]|nr:(deoxy)nucleoside triphosphate pyrophosphohydrolase [Myxococcales bacterium]
MSAPPKRMIRVVAAEITNDQGQYLITQRLPHAAMPLMWEFPGGKVEAGEGDRAALVREITEELDVTIEVAAETLQAVHDYDRYSIDFHSFAARIAAGTPKRIGVWDFRWVSADEFGDYRFPPADQDTIDRLIGLDN